MRRTHGTILVVIGAVILLAGTLAGLGGATVRDLFASGGAGGERGERGALEQATRGFGASSAALGAATLAVLTGDVRRAIRHAHDVFPQAGAIDADDVPVHPVPRISQPR